MVGSSSNQQSLSLVDKGHVPTGTDVHSHDRLGRGDESSPIKADPENTDDLTFRFPWPGPACDAAELG